MSSQRLFGNMERTLIAGAGTPGRVFRLPIWAPDPCHIVSASIFDQGLTPGKSGIWQLCIDKGGKYVDATGYPLSQICPPGCPRCHQSLGVLANYVLDTAKGLGQPYIFKPGVRYSRKEGDLILADLPCNGGISAQMVWQIGWEEGDAPALPTSPATYAAAFSKSPAGTNAANLVSIRNLCSLTAGGARVRATFKAGSGGRYTVENAAIGLSNGAYSDTADFPVELTFGGDSGFDIAAGATIQSDWAELTTAAGQTAVVITDNRDQSNDSISAGGSLYYSTLLQTYAMKKAGPLMGSAAGTHGVVSIECGT